MYENFCPIKKFWKFKLKNFGFTLVELLVAVSILGIIFGIGISQYIRFNRRQLVEQTALTLKNNLRLAQNKAIAGEKPSDCLTLEGYKVVFISGGEENPDSYKIIPSCGGWESENVLVFEIPKAVRFSPLPSPILFKTLALGTNLTQDMTITLKGFNNDEYVKTITITSSGEIR